MSNEEDRPSDRTTDSDESPPVIGSRKPFYKQKRFWLGLVMAPVFIALSGWLLTWIDVQRRLSAARADGWPTSNEELEQYYQLPADCPDSTQQWFDAMEVFCTPYPFPFQEDLAQQLDNRFSVPCVGEVWENEQLSRELLAGRQAAVQQLYEVASTEGAFRFPTRIEDGYWSPRQDGRASLHDTTALLHLDAAIAARDNNISRAVRDVEVILAIGKASRFEVSSYVLHRHVRHSVMASIAVVHCSPEKWTDGDAERIQQELHEVDFRSAWLRHMKGAVGCGFVDISRNAPLHLKGLNQREFLKFYDTALNPEPASWWQTFQQDSQAINEFEEQYYGSDLYRYVYRPLGKCGFPIGDEYLARCDTERQCAIVVLAMARHRLRHGSYPQTASDIDGDLFPDGLPRDPWLTTSSIKVLRSGDAFTVYGVGEDRVDDGGKVEYIDGANPADTGYIWKPVSIDSAAP